MPICDSDEVKKLLVNVTSLYTTTEAKYVLLVMCMCGVDDASYDQLANACGMDNAEVADAANMLKVMKINVSRDFNRVVLDAKYRSESVPERDRASVRIESDSSSGAQGTA